MHLSIFESNIFKEKPSCAGPEIIIPKFKKLNYNVNKTMYFVKIKSNRIKA